MLSFPTFRQTLQLPFSGLIYVGGFRKLYIEQVVRTVYDVKDLIGGTEELVAIQ
jgi:hypothetical protein